MTNRLKLKIYPAVLGGFGFVLLAVFLSRFEIQIATEELPVSDRTLSAERTLPAGPEASSEASPTAPSETGSNTSSKTDITPERSPAASPAAQAASPAPANATGSLRISNQTSYPVRVALLSIAGNPSARPVHWDFAPNEGSAKGLRLSLPDGTLQIQTGDVLVAFSEDGSRRYWGPFVLGKTASPTWNADSQEWQLDLTSPI